MKYVCLEWLTNNDISMLIFPDISRHFEEIADQDCSANVILHTTTWGAQPCAMMCRKYLNCQGVKWNAAVLEGSEHSNCFLFKECNDFVSIEDVTLYVKGIKSIVLIFRYSVKNMF